MKTTLSKIITIIMLVTSCFFSIATFVPVYADNTDLVCGADVAEEVKRANGCPGYGTEDQLRPVVTNILNAIIAVSGLVAVVFIIMGGISYMTSTGDAAKTKKAKDTILYACIGLAICALAFAIVNFVIINIIGGGS